MWRKSFRIRTFVIKKPYVQFKKQFYPDYISYVGENGAQLHTFARVYDGFPKGDDYSFHFSKHSLLSFSHKEPC